MKIPTAPATLLTTCLCAAAGVARADEPVVSDSAFKVHAPSFSFSMADPPATEGESKPAGTAEAGDAAKPEEEAGGAEGAARKKYRFGDAGSTWLTFGGGAAFAFTGDDRDYNAFGAWSIFLADSLEFSVELGGWYFDQEGPDTGGINGSMIFRWHLWMSDDREWTVYGDVGIGLLGAFDEVPDGGTSFDFTPRAGGGFTYELDEESQTRLMVGVRWHHISNGRINSDANNPSRDSIMIYAGVIFPF